MGIGRWLQVRDARNTYSELQKLPDEALRTLPSLVITAAAKVMVEHSISVIDILESESFNMADDCWWIHVPAILNTQYRIPCLKAGNSGNDQALALGYAYSIATHSVRAVLDYENSGNKKLMFWGQKIWRLIDPERTNTPLRFS
ncbi:hypothetical protein [Aliikangiella maris]|uniref:Uncharacterized protein n=2 Tax=Aliikangiella maris TaxID=3162458 RepID=A0ABV3MLF4_9GAMM